MAWRTTAAEGGLRHDSLIKKIHLLEVSTEIHEKRQSLKATYLKEPPVERAGLRWPRCDV